MIQRKSTETILFDSLYELMKTYPFKAITIQMIVDNCGKTKPTFYKYFKDKYELLCSNSLSFKSCFRANSELIDFYATSLSLLELIYADLHFYKNAFSYEGQNSFSEAISQGMFESHYDWIKRICEPDEEDLEDIVYTLEFYCIGLVAKLREWTLSDAKVPVEDFARKSMLCMPPILRKYFYIKSNDCPNKGNQF